MTRSIWKAPFCQVEFFTLSNHKIFSRRSVILPKFLGKHFEIHNGKTFISLRVSEEMIGHKFGEFSSTRRKPVHKKKQKKRK